MNEIIDVSFWKKYLKKFARKRDWDQFHSPKNLSMALSVEASELVEIFQWLSPEKAAKLSEERRQHVAEELSDILLYAIRLSDKLDINLEEALDRKAKMNELKYPLEKALKFRDEHL